MVRYICIKDKIYMLEGDSNAARSQHSVQYYCDRLNDLTAKLEAYESFVAEAKDHIRLKKRWYENKDRAEGRYPLAITGTLENMLEYFLPEERSEGDG